MAQINSYTDSTAYSADESRDATKSSVSLIESTNEVVYDGVNVVVSKPYAEIGDLVAFDKEAKETVFVKGSTLNADVLPATLVPMAVVYARKGDKVLIVSLENAKDNGSESIRWAAPYEVALSGFDLVSGGTFVIKIGQEGSAEELSITYDAGASLADIALLVNGSLKSGGSRDYSTASYGGWAASAGEGIVVMSSNSSSSTYSIIGVTSGCEIEYPSPNINYQTTLTDELIDGITEYIRRSSGANTSSAGCSIDMFMQYYSTSGSDTTGVKIGSTTIIRESAFTEEANPELVAAYSTYKDYLLGEHIIKYPSVYGVLLRNGKANTAKIGSKQFVDCRGESSSCYPAAARALGYGIVLDGYVTGLEAGAWWLPSVEEIYLLMRDRASEANGKEDDQVNKTLSLLNKDTLYGSQIYLLSSCVYNANNIFMYSKTTGALSGNPKYISFAVRPISAL